MQTFLHILPENLRTADIFRQEEKTGELILWKITKNKEKPEKKWIG